VTKQEERIEKMKAEGKDEYDIRKQQEVLEESRMMIPDTNRRLKAAKDDLSQLLVCFLVYHDFKQDLNMFPKLSNIILSKVLPMINLKVNFYMRLLNLFASRLDLI
jgi:hypothetical protein